MNRYLGIMLLALSVSGGCGFAEDLPGASAEASDVTDSVHAQPIEFLGLRGWIPHDWMGEPPASAMRLAQYRLPEMNGSAGAEFVLFYFGPGQGGSPAANIARWRSQFGSTPGGPVERPIEKLEIGDLVVTVVSFTGEYARGVGMGATVAIADQTLLAAIVETPSGNVYTQLHGDSQAVEPQTDAFLAFIRSLKPV